MTKDLTHDLPLRIDMLMTEAYDIASAVAILNQRHVGSGFVVVMFDPTIDKIVCYYLSRKDLYKNEISMLFSRPARDSILLLTRNYNPKNEFCVCIPDQVEDVFYSLKLPFKYISPKMSDKELHAVIDATPKQEVKSKFLTKN